MAMSHDELVDELVDFAAEMGPREFAALLRDARDRVAAESDDASDLDEDPELEGEG